jgi:hypothetical protein
MKFKSTHDGPVTLFVLGKQIYLVPDGEYETDDKAEIEELKASSFVKQVQTTKGKRRS